MMAHWRLSYGDRLLTVLYEDLARDAATVGARIYDFCGLDCDPEAFSGAFTTDEIGRSTPYTPYLKELRNALSGLTRQPQVARGTC